MPPASRGGILPNADCLIACLLICGLNSAEGSWIWLERTQSYGSDGHAVEQALDAALSNGHSWQGVHPASHHAVAQRSQLHDSHLPRASSAARQDAAATAAHGSLPDLWSSATLSVLRHMHASRQLQESVQGSDAPSLRDSGNRGGDQTGPDGTLPGLGGTGGQPLDPGSRDPYSFHGNPPQLGQPRTLSETATQDAASAQQAAGEASLQPAESAHSQEESGGGSQQSAQQQQQQQLVGSEERHEAAGGVVGGPAVQGGDMVQASAGEQNVTWWGAGAVLRALTSALCILSYYYCIQEPALACNCAPMTGTT